MSLLKINCFQIYDLGVIRQGMIPALRANPREGNAITLYIQHEIFLLTQVHKAGFTGFSGQEYGQLHDNGIKNAEFSYVGGRLTMCYPASQEHFIYIDLRSAHIGDRLVSFSCVETNQAGKLEILFTKGAKNTKQIIFLKVQRGTSFQTIETTSQECLIHNYIVTDSGQLQLVP